ncbi:ATP-dependent RNA helicase DDX18/HAS1 [Nematocida sp. AWRm77]|nr:ATP-dependent RNA helicase DDX18/HAS1 [Nematocida sp. AWRm77]
MSTTDSPQFGGLSEASIRALKQMDIEALTDIQRKSLRLTLRGKDLLGIANTGSGKTLAFLLPAFEMLCAQKRTEGYAAAPQVLVISPTRELALQTFRVARRLMASEQPGIVLLVGGTKKAVESEEIKKGCRVLVCTPGRLLDHLISGLSLSHVKLVVLDESDRILDVGFAGHMDEILSHLPKKRQTLMFSATKNNTEAFSKKWLSSKHRKVEVKTDNQVTPTTLQQSFIVCGEDKRFSLLFSFLKQTKEKVVVFFSTCASVSYHGELFSLLKFNVAQLHGGIKQERRAKIFDGFCSGEIQILFSTDVAARGLDVPNIGWIVQYDPPTDPKEYIHRVGRTARAGDSGKALMFLLPHEKVFIKYLKQLGVEVEEWEAKETKDITEVYTKTVSRNYYLEKSAKDALKAYLQAYAGHKLKTVFNASKIELNKISKSFGLPSMPDIDITICASKK